MTGNHLKAFRVEYRLTQGELAARLGVARSTLNGYERGHAPVPLVIGLALAAIAHNIAPYQPPATILNEIALKRHRRITRVCPPMDMEGPVLNLALGS